MNRLLFIIKKLVPQRLRGWLARMRHEHMHYVVSNTQDDVAFCLLGNPDRRAHLARIYLRSASEYRVRRGLHRKNWSALALDQARRHGMVVATDLELPAELEPLRLRVPHLVAMNLDLRESEAAFLKKLSHSARSDVVKVTRAGYQAEVETNPEWAFEFFARYHEKALKQRYGAEAYVMPAQTMANLLARKACEFVCITLDGQRLAAVMCDVRGANYRMGRLGWLDGNPDLVKKGVLAAVYWFAMRRARELGKTTIMFGGTPGYFEDGVFAYKMKWGAVLSREDTTFGIKDMVLDPTHPQARAMLARNSFIGVDADERFVVYSCKEPRDVRITAEMQNCIARWYQPDPAGKPFVFSAIPEWPQ